jgi:hypothetical protein
MRIDRPLLWRAALPKALPTHTREMPVANLLTVSLEPEHLDLPRIHIDNAVEVIVPKLLVHSMVAFE